MNRSKMPCNLRTNCFVYPPHFFVEVFSKSAKLLEPAEHDLLMKLVQVQNLVGLYTSQVFS